ncbi:MAG: hypothetical protein LBM99_04495, partial [Bacillales bacterium]|nr:hypothetical protein [Bacillales bacterium]
MARYIPEINYSIPDRTDVHMLKVKIQVNPVFDENFDYKKRDFFTSVMGVVCRLILFALGWAVFFVS